MRLHQLFSSLLIRWFGGIVLVFSAFSVMYAQSPRLPPLRRNRQRLITSGRRLAVSTTPSEQLS